MGDKLQFGELVPLADFALATGEEGSEVITVQLMQPGQFIDAAGRPLTITDDKLDAYERNYNANVAGQQLPVFVGHPARRAEAPAAAWFKRVYTQVVEGAKTLWAELELTALGKQTLETGLYKYISASVDLANDVIMGAGFCNMPAITGMEAIELSQFLHEPGGEPEAVGLLRQLVAGIKRLPELWANVPGLADLATTTVDPPEHLISEGNRMENLLDLTKMTAEQLAEYMAAAVETALAKRDADLTASLSDSADLEQMGQRSKQFADLLQKHDEERVAEWTRQAERNNGIADFVRTVTDGEAALSTAPDDLTAFLSGLNDDQLATVKAILTTKVADLSERGHTGAGDGLRPLPAEAKAGLEAHLAQGGELQDFIDGNPELRGSDFSAYQAAE